MLKSGLVSVSFRSLPPEEIVRLAAGCGLGAIEWGGDVHVPPGDIANAARVGEMTRAAGLAVSSYGSYYRLGAYGDGYGDVFPGSFVRPRRSARRSCASGPGGRGAPKRRKKRAAD